MTRYIQNFLMLLLVFLSQLLYSQTYPVQAVPTVISPYSSKITDYSNAMVNRINLQLITTDLLVQNRPAQLHLKIQGNGITAQSNPVLSGIQPVYLNGGEILSLTSADLAGYFRYQNLQGLTSTQYSEPLPDGVYTICFHVYDIVTRKWLSQSSCATIYLMLNDPPQLNLPSNNEQIPGSDFPNIIFSWTPRHMNATNVSYDYELKEILDPNLDPAFAFEVSPLLHKEEGLRTTTLLYDISKPTLIPGKRYAWRVKAISTSGLAENSVFKNNGFSQIHSFTYNSNCDAPRYLLSEQQSQSRVKLMWQGENTHKKYHVQYRKANVENAEWFEVYTVNTQTILQDLEAGFTYEFRVGATCDATLFGTAQSYVYSGIQTFEIDKDENATAYNCGIVPDIEVTNQQPLPALAVNETFMAGDFPVKVLSVQGSSGVFSGTGYIQVPYLFDTRIGVVFDNIRINSDYQLVDGMVETTYDPEWGSVIDADDLIEELKQIGKDFIALYNDLADGKYKDKTEEEKEELIDKNQDEVEKYIQTIDALLNSGAITKEEAQALKGKLEESKDCFENGVNCKEETVSEPSTNNGPSVGNYYYFDCVAEWESCKEKAEAVKKEIEALAEKSAEKLGMLTYSDFLNDLSFENNGNDRYKFYLSPAAQVVVLPAEAIPTFSKELENPEIKDLHIPDGALTGFTLNNEFYAGRYRKVDDKWRFEGYRHCYNRDDEGICTKDKFYVDINNQYNGILEKIVDRDETVLATLNKASFEELALTIGFGGTISNPAITAQVEILIAQNLGRYATTVKQGGKIAFRTFAIIALWNFLVTPSTIETVGTGTVVPSLPLDITAPTGNGEVLNPPLAIPISVPHKIPENKGDCSVYVIFRTNKTTGKIEVAKYGITCQVEEDGTQCDTRPQSQVNYFNSHIEAPYLNSQFVYQWAWIPYAKNVSKSTSLLVEKSLTGSYIILNNGNLPPLHKLPCFKKINDDFADITEYNERIRRVQKYIEEMIKKYGSQ